MVREISPAEAYEQLSADPAQTVLLDVRSPAEFDSVRAKPAVLLSLPELSSSDLSSFQGKKVLCICKAGGRSRQAADLLLQKGLNNVSSVAGGTDAWVQQNLPFLRGESKVISMERQVRIAAGSLVALGTVLGLVASSKFFALPLFVGMGLVYSGISDTCGMAVVLSRMPWNSSRKSSCSSPLS